MAALLMAALLVAALWAPTATFIPIGGGGSTHVSITGNALMQKVTETCKAVAEDGGYKFEPTGSSPEELVQACLGPTATGDVSGAKFHAALQEIFMQNGPIDRDFANSAPHHFNSEAFLQGRGLITEGTGVIKANIRKENFKAARETLGRVLHTLQDFYSHSNWVELGFSEPYVNLIQPDLTLDNIADADTATCSDCSSGNCPNPLLPNILLEKKLTSGYMGIFSSSKPKGKCSHGGAGDLTSSTVPRGGISKDERRSHNAVLHNTAANLATQASLQLLENIRLAAGDVNFLRMMGVARSSVVCFVIDTTGSMSDDIEEARSVAYEIIDSKKGTQDEPSEYILVPFNDPKFGPMIRTVDPEEMKKEISKLKANGGGDHPEMCLSGLQLALTGAPSSSHIYVFTDATAKDIALKDTIVALIRSTKSTVSFFMTGPSKWRWRRDITAGSFDDYKDLALASGGQAIQVSKAQLPQATVVILDSSTSALVTVLQRARSPGKQETFPFVLDDSLKNITIYITGTSISFILTNPEGVTQSSSETSGKLGTIHAVGNLRRIRIHSDKQTGSWRISITTTQPYTLKVTGQSSISFIYDFVESFGGAHPGYAVVTGRPPAGAPAMLMLTVMGRKGPSSLEVVEAGLVLVSGPEQTTNSSLSALGNGDFLLTVDSVPEGEFVVFLRGTDKESKSTFLRQSTTQMSVSKVNIKATVDSSVEPGKPLSLLFSVMTQSSGGSYTIDIKNDKNFTMTYPNSLTLTTGQYANATMTITPPASTPSGTDVTVTMEAAKGSDSNYAILRLSVITKITDFAPPLCNVVRVAAQDCPSEVSQCEPFHWELWANITDANGTGVESVSLRQGNGSLSLSALSAPSVHAAYNASCCSHTLELVAVDQVGNVGRCFHSIQRSAGVSTALTPGLSLWVALILSAFMATLHC
ncbi:von Willebrand factor A domain-containing protein 7 [Gouania willdenowi]|uniref:von Willebrand factor A domain-containing protein 7-like n=1 Tax=Gouania willdenowi TaxID=441366 RepID=A0A8C5D4M4_GOUWI|nr:von Willebrand factor A domain-containing protein 7-like [Gouania willdenowi]XP_028311437.1 von Willebrand factor A domain-containing protein 7-like [Gouania willdenowi]XP_028311445.1 von Willebrand factor A domain-containing protein 7-like [Gouania willdenowi]XP_028311454.1 von Willebrand factor A domain-containing protein 7-like [Gouania willdenowi]